DHSAGYIPPPTDASEVEAYVAAVKALPDAHAHGDDPSKAGEHMQLLELVERAEATHVAIGDGDWFDASNWYEGRIPDVGAKVLIPEGISLRYEGESDASLFTVRVDGELSFATDADSKMLLDTMVVSPTGRLEIGTEENPIQANVDVQIVIANNGDIDTSWDPMLLSRGVISHGEVEIHGAEKESFLKVDDAPMAGDTQIQLAEVPEGWQVGDTIVLSGTHKEGRQWAGQRVHVESQDEEVTITAINGATISIDRPLQYDHDTPRDDLKAYVANMTRNVTISSEDGESTEVHHRGHTMFMHSDDVDVRYAAFDDLGRTDKSVPAADLDAFASIESDTNIKGRYSFHFHKTGTEDQEDPAIAIGNTVSGSPGWGFVHHSSHANFTENVAFEVFGAAFAAEDGDETGIWLRNMAIRSEGLDRLAKDATDGARHDNGRTGDGFFFAGRLVEAAENVAVNTSNGFVWMHRSAPSAPLANNLHQPELGYGAETVPVGHAPIQGFRDNEAFGTELGLHIVKANPAQETDVRTVLDGFLNWETAQGVQIGYTSHYTLKDFDLVATQNITGYGGPWIGIGFANNVFDFVVNGLTAEGFQRGVDLDNTLTLATPDWGDSDFDNILIDVTMIDVDTEYVGFNPARHSILTSDDLTPGRLEFDMQGDTTLSWGETFYFNGIKTDSVGSRDRQFHGDEHKLTAHEVRELLSSDGYYEAADGRKVMLIEDFIADRATGELKKFAHVVTLNFSDSQLNSLNAPFNGPIDLNSAAPNARDDAFGINQNQDILLNVLGNDSDPDGDTLRVDGLTNPEHGDVYLQDNGQLLYRPDVDFTGEDSFTYWATDNNGNYENATVT
ncbi:cadherin-like domain-containing protein, partial [Ruegeria sp. R13_0]|uniref:Ig-like domain-containing protein n=1 Tax=Ruegeria sp. R13_0 TaxID=2821099 RepID=UPI001ADAD7A1